MATKKTPAKKVPAKKVAAKKEVAKKVSTKKNVDPGRPISRPMAPPSKDAGWGQTLTKKELLGIIDRIYAKQAERERLSKLKK